MLFKEKVSGSISLETIYKTKLKENTDISEYVAVQETYRDKEIESGFCLFGPHKDDVLFLSQQRLFKECSSLGQMRIAGIILKVVQIQEFVRQGYKTPILLLDDVFFELDPEHRQVMRDFFYNDFSDMQVFECVNDRNMVQDKDSLVIRLG